MLIRPTNILVVYPYVLVGLSARLDLKPSMRGCPRSPFLLTDAKGGSRAIDNAWRWSVMEDDDDAPTRHAHRSESEIPDLTPPKIKSVCGMTEGDFEFLKTSFLRYSRVGFYICHLIESYVVVLMVIDALAGRAMHSRAEQQGLVPGIVPCTIGRACYVEPCPAISSDRGTIGTLTRCCTGDVRDAMSVLTWLLSQCHREHYRNMLYHSLPPEGVVPRENQEARPRASVCPFICFSSVLADFVKWALAT
ncbi:hypothetical protein BHE74_00019358 [Ensete ventricosum]|nr:hypothetical protein GW17_00022327 [Ensete ventricosum]RWW72813.1 hypothetical protein BHE74_00019358 [Ensete ventricosum]